jgi:hypothetical protein
MLDAYEQMRTTSLEPASELILDESRLLEQGMAAWMLWRAKKQQPALQERAPMPFPVQRKKSEPTDEGVREIVHILANMVMSCQREVSVVY